MPSDEHARLRFTPATEVDLARSMHGLTRGATHPTARITADGAVWVTARLASGEVCARFSRSGIGPALHRDIVVDAFGPGARAFLDQAPAWTGEHDDWSGFIDSPSWQQLPRSWRRAYREKPGLRLISTGQLLPQLIAATLEQRVTGGEAVAAQRWMARQHGTPAPGPAPAGMMVFPDAARIRAIPSWQWHRAGVDSHRAATILRIASRAGALQRLAQAPADESLHRALRSIEGVGAWTVAETLQLTHGDPDAISIYDYHLAKHVTEFFDGRRGGDARMLELLEPWRGNRQRVVRLMFASGWSAQAKGPKLTPQDHRDK